MNIIKYNSSKDFTNARTGSNTTVINGGTPSGSNSESSAKLSETHLIFGNPFDGTQDVSGNITNVQNITAVGGDVVVRSQTDSEGEYGGNIEADKDIKAGGNVTATKFIGNVEASDVTTNTLQANDGMVTSISGTSLNYDNADIRQAIIDTLQSTDITTENLTVTKQAHFFELIIDKIKAAGGAVILSPADGFKVDKVSDISSGYRVYWKATDGEKSISNMWKVNDQAICQTFNAATGTSYNVSNKYYWSLVTAVGTESIDGTDYHYLDLSGTTVDGTLNPEVGDEIAMLGYRGTDDSNRQSAIYIAAYNSIDSELKAPLFAHYRGINDFNLKAHKYTWFAANGNTIRGDLLVDNGQNVKDYVGQQTDALLAITDSIQAVVERNTNSISGLDGRITTNTNDIATLTQKADSIESKVTSSINSISIGGRNLVSNSKINTTSSNYGFGARGVTLIEGETYTLSVNGHISQTAQDNGYCLATFINLPDWSWSVDFNIDSLSDTTESITFTYTKPTSNCSLMYYMFPSGGTREGDVTVNWVKLERGNKATDWTPNPDDIDSQIETINTSVSTITQKADSIESKVTTINKSLRGDNILAGVGNAMYWTGYTNFSDVGYYFTIKYGTYLVSPVFQDSVGTYTLSFNSWTGTINVDIYEFNEFNKLGSDPDFSTGTKIARVSTANVDNSKSQCMHFDDTLGRYYFTFTETTSSAKTFRLRFDTFESENYIQKIMVEEGSVPHAFNESYAVTQSQILQNSTQILSRITKEDDGNLLGRASYDSVGESGYSADYFEIDAPNINLYRGTDVTDESNKIVRYDKVFYNGSATFSAMTVNKDVPIAGYFVSPAFPVTEGQTYSLFFDCDLYQGGGSANVRFILEVNHFDTLEGAIANHGFGSAKNIWPMAYTGWSQNNPLKFQGAHTGYARLRFILEINDLGTDPLTFTMSKVRIYEGDYSYQQIPYWNDNYYKSYSEIRQTADEIKLQVSDINVRINDKEIELNGDTKVNGTLTLTDSEQGFILNGGSGMTLISPQSIGTYPTFESKASTINRLYGSAYSSGDLKINADTVDFTFKKTFNIGTIQSGKNITLSNGSLKFQKYSTVTEISVSNLDIKYKVYEGSSLKATYTSTQLSQSTIGTVTLSSTSEVKIMIEANVTTSMDYFKTSGGMQESPQANCFMNISVSIPNDAFTLVGYDGIGLNFGNSGVIYMGQSECRIKYGDNVLKVAGDGLYKYAGTTSSAKRTHIVNGYTYTDTAYSIFVSEYAPLNGYKVRKVTSSGNVYADLNDDYILCRHTSGTVNVFLGIPAYYTGKCIRVKGCGQYVNVYAGISTSNSTYKIIRSDGGEHYGLTSDYNACRCFWSDGSYWYEEFLGY